MKNHKFHRGIWIAPNARAFELLESKDPIERKMAEQVITFCEKAAACNYEIKALTALREQYKEVL